jgi:hypothetical protein
MNPPRIDSYRFGEIIIDGQVYDKDLIITPHGITPDWWRAEGHSLSIPDLEVVLAAPPEVLIIGQGAYGRMEVPEATRRELTTAGVEVLAQRTAEACQSYNQLVGEKKVIAALHLTC